MKALLAILLAGKFGKFLITGGSMLLSVFAYALIYGWWYSIGFVGLILVHEMGHYLAAQSRGLSVGAPTFIPFVGAWIQLKEQPMDSETEAFVGIAGPILGSAGAFICFLLARENGSLLLMALAYSGFVLNLFNLIPLTPLDGGRIVSVISPRVWIVGIPILVGLFIWKPNPLLLLIAIVAVPQVWSALKDRDKIDSVYYRASREVRLKYGGQYLALTGFLAAMTFEVHSMLPAR